MEELTKDREFYAGQTANEKDLRAKDNALKQEDRKAVNAYKEQLKQEERNNIANSIAASQRQKEKALLEHRKMLDLMHEDFELRAKAWADVNEYKSKEKERSRQSICLRLDSWRQSRMAAERQKAQQQLAAEEDAALRSEDFLAVQNARRQEELEERAKNIKCFL